MARRLPMPAMPHPDESLVGYIARLSHVNRIGRTFTVLLRSGFHSRFPEAAAFEPFPLRILSDLSGVRTSALRALAYWPVSGGTRPTFLSQPVPPDLLTLANRRCCPACLKVSGYHRATWDLSFFVCCPEHRCLLIGRCPKCKRRLTWRFSDLTKCTCGFRLHGAATRHVPPEALVGTRAALDLMCSNGGTLAKMAELSGLQPGSMVRWMYALGWLALGNTRRLRPIKAAADPYEVLKALNRGYFIAKDWPGGFHKYLDRLAAMSGKRTGRYGLLKSLGTVGQWLIADDHPKDVQQFNRFILEQYASNRPVFRFRTRRILGDTETFCTLKRASRLLGRSVTRVKRILVQYGYLCLDRHHGKGAPLLVESKAIRTIHARLRTLVDKTQVIRMLGCRKALGLKLIPVLPVRPAVGIAADLFGRTCWQKAEIETFLTSLRSIVNTQPPSLPVIPLTMAISRMHTRGLAMAAILRPLSIINAIPGRLISGRAGLAAVFVVPYAFEELVAGSNTLSVPATAKALGIKEETAYLLRRRKIIQTQRVPGILGDRVSAETIHRFQETYVIPGRLGSDAGHHRGWTSDRLIASGLKPVSGPSVDDGRYYLFRRSDVLRAAGKGLSGVVHNPLLTYQGH